MELFKLIYIFTKCCFRLYQDISYASQCGYQKLLVLSGQNKLKEANIADGAFKPNFYLNNLGDLVPLIDKCDLNDVI